MPHETLLEIPQGSDGSWLFTAKNETTGAIINLTGATISFRVESAVPIILGIGTGITIVNALLGQFRVTLTDEQAQIRRQAYAYECRVTEASGDKTLVAWGQLLLQGPTSGTITEGTPADTPPGFLSVRDFGAVGGGVDADDSGFQSALDQAESLGAGVFVPPVEGGYRWTAPITGRKNVWLLGVNQGLRRGSHAFPPEDPHGSHIAIAHVGVGMHLARDMCVDGLEFYYPNQVLTGTPIVHDWTLAALTPINSVTIRNVQCANPYKFIKLVTDGGKLENIYAFPLRAGLELGRCADKVYGHTIHFNPNCNQEVDSGVKAWAAANCDAFKLGGVEGFEFHQIFAFGCIKGIWFADSTPITGNTGTISGGAFDQVGVGVLVTNKGVVNDGVAMSDFTIIPLDEGIKFDDSTALAADKPSVYWSNVRVFNGAGYERAVWMTAGSRGELTWNGGYANNYTSEMFLVQSATTRVMTTHVENRQGGTRVNNPAGGTFSELGAY